MELRCGGRLHGILQDGVVEFKCNSSFCGAKPGVVVLHKFDVHTGELLDTVKYKEPPTTNGRKGDGACSNSASLRSA